MGGCTGPADRTPGPGAAPTGAAPTGTGTPGTGTPGTGTPGTEPTAPAGFVSVADVVPDVRTDIRYATDHNFVGRPIDGYAEPLCLLTRAAAEALGRVAAGARSRGYLVKVYDCYRPQRAVDDFIRWAADPDRRMKEEFYPRVAKDRLFPDGYIGGPTAHSRGSTVDLTLVAVPPADQPAYLPGQPLVPCTAPRAERFPDNSVDMGTGFDCFDPLAHTLDDGVTGDQRRNRLLLRQLMTAAGFVNYPKEWWHYTLAGEPYPDTYFDFPVTRFALVGGR
ncbi:D-alanyl-D-alanine dipeptidase [Plantactinospora sp. KBS50]|nr:D-alanyl-D-alanine dipeptidase [Plantactinospora sp. KBS50]